MEDYSIFIPIRLIRNWQFKFSKINNIRHKVLHNRTIISYDKEIRIKDDEVDEVIEKGGIYILEKIKHESCLTNKVINGTSTRIATSFNNTYKPRINSVSPSSLQYECKLFAKLSDAKASLEYSSYEINSLIVDPGLSELGRG